MSYVKYLGSVAEVNGRLARVISVCDSPEVTFEFVGGRDCPACGRPDRVSVVIGSRNWDSWVKPVKALP